MSHSIIYPELQETTNAEIEFVVSHSGGYRLTTDLTLTGRGIKMTGGGKDHARNKKTYQVTEKALELLKTKHTCCYIANL